MTDQPFVDPGLARFATPRELEIITLANQTRSWRAVDRTLGIRNDSARSAFERLKRRAALKGYAPEADMTHPVPSPFQVKGVSTYYNRDGKPVGQWVKSRVDADVSEEIVRDFLATLAAEPAVLKSPAPRPPHVQEDLLAVYPLGDPHLGMVAWADEAGDEFDLLIAQSQLEAAVDHLAEVMPPAKTAILLSLGDLIHSDTEANTSRSGHPLDAERWAKVTQVGLKTMIYAARRLLEKHDQVVVRLTRGNHDGHTSYALAVALDAFFANEPRIHVNLSPAAHWYFEFGKVLLGATHGDTTKKHLLPGVMAADQAEAWGRTRHRYWLCGHVHHIDVQEFAGVVVEYFRTLAAKDAWHAGQGYRSGRDMKGIVYHREHGEVGRHTCDIGMAARRERC